MIRVLLFVYSALLDDVSRRIDPVVRLPGEVGAFSRSRVLAAILLSIGHARSLSLAATARHIKTSSANAEEDVPLVVEVGW
jgi:hypothetical protein